MWSLLKLFDKWEIQLLVLLSFTLQLFLFFAGHLRRRSASMILRFSLWMAYLGADLVAIYALGFLSRHTDGGDALTETHPLAFLWTPFLLLHLGGQDTITAFAMEDNNLWLRHLLNLLIQVVLTLYVLWEVLWESIGSHSGQLLVPSIFLFVAGIIKYGERIWALKCGRLKGFGSSSSGDIVELAPDMTGGYLDILYSARRGMVGVRGLFCERRVSILGVRQMNSLGSAVCTYANSRTPFYDWGPKLLETELGMMYDELYTKAMVLRRGSGVVLRCISQISMMASLVLFLVSHKQRYNQADIAITYVLFTGSIFLEASSVCIFLASPGTWAWLEARKWGRLPRMSLRLVSSGIGWPEEGRVWSGKMGQLAPEMEEGTRLLSGGIDEQRAMLPVSRRQRVLVAIRKTARFVGAKTLKLIWIRQLLRTRHIEVDYTMLLRSMAELMLMKAEASREEEGSTVQVQLPRRRWLHVRNLVQIMTFTVSIDSFGSGICLLQHVTERILRKYSPSSPREGEGLDEDEREMVEFCRKVSNYVAYLSATYSSMVPNGGHAEHVVDMDSVEQRVRSNLEDCEELAQFYSSVESLARHIDQMPPTREALEELIAMWIRLLIYAAGKSPPEMHAAQLARGGELLTFLWLFMSHSILGDSAVLRIELTNSPGIVVREVSDGLNMRDTSLYAFDISNP